MHDLEVEGPAAASVRLDAGPCDGHRVVLLNLIVAVVVTRDHANDKWMIHEYFTGDRPELVANEVAYYRRVDDRRFIFVPGILAMFDDDGQPHWTLAATPAMAAVP